MSRGVSSHPALAARVIGVLAMLGAFLGTTSTAYADTSIIVVGLRSQEGDDDFARNLTVALRSAFTGVADFRMLNREVSLAQLSLAYDCEVTDSACMVRIARDLEAQQVVYGSVQRTSPNEDTYSFQVSLAVFDSASGQVAYTVVDSIPHNLRSTEDLQSRAARYVQQLTGQLRVGSLRIQTNTPGAPVHLDGTVVGMTDGRGLLLIEDVRPGQHRVEVTEPGYGTERRTVEITGNEIVEVSLALRPEPLGDHPAGAPDAPDRRGSSRPKWPAYVALGVSAASFGVVLYTWIRMDQIRATWGLDLFEDDPEYEWYGAYVAETALAREDITEDPEDLDICDTVNDDRFNYMGSDADTRDRVDSARRTTSDLCEEASTLEVLQYVFLGLGIVSAGVGIYLLLDDGEDEERADSTSRPRVSLTPTFGREGGRLNLTVQF